MINKYENENKSILERHEEEMNALRKAYEE